MFAVICMLVVALAYNPTLVGITLRLISSPNSSVPGMSHDSDSKRTLIDGFNASLFPSSFILWNDWTAGVVALITLFIWVHILPWHWFRPAAAAMAAVGGAPQRVRVLRHEELFVAISDLTVALRNSRWNVVRDRLNKLWLVTLPVSRWLTACIVVSLGLYVWAVRTTGALTMIWVRRSELCKKL